MVGIMLVTVNVRERQILTMAFEQLKIKVVQSSPSYSNYVKVLQYQPDIIVMEIPRYNNDQVHFSSLIRKNKRTKKVPVIGYGDKIDDMQMRFIVQQGISQYLNRPLKFSALLEMIKKYLKVINKSLDASLSDPAKEKDADIALILDKNTLPTKKIELIVKHISGLMAFPFTVAKVLSLSQSDKSGAGDLAKVIEADPVISASILKVSNTVFFASLNRRINTIKDAIVRIGFRETKKIVMTMSVMEMFNKEEEGFGLNKMDFWVHSLATALISENVAKRMGDINTDEAFLAGLLHDFGVLLFEEFFPTIFTSILENTTNSGTRFIDNEKALIKITRNDIINELFTKWKLPENITEAITSHYTICTEEKQVRRKNERVALSTYIGNVLAKTFCFGGVCDHYITPIEDVFFYSAKMPNGLNKDFYENTSREVLMYKKFLGLGDDEKDTELDVKKIGVFSPANWKFNPIQEYFATQGHEVVPIPPTGSYTAFDKACDAIFVCAGKDTTLKEIAPILELKPYSVPTTSESGSDPTTPVCALVYQDSQLDTDANGAFSLMHNEFDLRQLDENLHKMLKGEKFTVTNKSAPSAAEPTSPPPAQ